MIVKSGLSLAQSDQHFLSKSMISLEQTSLSREGRRPDSTLLYISKRNSFNTCMCMKEDGMYNLTIMLVIFGFRFKIIMLDFFSFQKMC